MRGAWRRKNPRRRPEIPSGSGQLNRRAGGLEPGGRHPARRDLTYLTLWLAAASLLMTLPHRHQLVLATAVRSTVLAPILKLQSGFSEVRTLGGRLGALRSERDSLAARILANRNLEEENARLRALLGLAQRGTDMFIAANLYPVGRPGELIKRSFVIDVGARAGVARDAAVVSPGGVVGVVRAASGGQAIGHFWTHPDFRASAMTGDGDVYGIISPSPEAPEVMRLDGVPFQAELATGTPIVTSGMGGVFPRGIPVGEIVEVTEEEAGWARSYLVRPFVHPDGVREVMVLVARGAADDLGAVWGLGGEPVDVP